MKHRLIPIDATIAERVSQLLTKYAAQGLRPADALVASTACSRRLPLLTSNTRHYRVIAEISMVDLVAL